MYQASSQGEVTARSNSAQPVAGIQSIDPRQVAHSSPTTPSAKAARPIASAAGMWPKKPDRVSGQLDVDDRL